MGDLRGEGREFQTREVENNGEMLPERCATLGMQRIQQHRQLWRCDEGVRLLPINHFIEDLLEESEPCC